MYASPDSLQDICFDCVANNIEIYCKTIQQHKEFVNRPCIKTTGFQSQLVFKDPDVYLHSEIAEQLLTALCDRGKLSDLNITLFDSKSTRLRQVRLQNAKLLTRQGLKVLKGHCINELEATGLRVPVNDLILSLGDQTLQNLKSLNVSRCSFLELDSTK